MAVTIHVQLSTDGRQFLIQTPFNSQWKDDFKAQVPPRERTWDGERKVWGVTRDFYNVTCEVTRRIFGQDCNFRLSAAAEAALTDLMVDELKEPSLEDYVILGLRPEATPIVIHAAYDACELFVTVRAYMTQHGADPRDVFFQKLPAWMRGRAKTDYVNFDDMRVLAANVDMGPGAPIETIRDAYQRICKHKDIDTIIPTATYEQLVDDGEPGDEEAKARRIAILSKALMDSMTEKK